MLTHLQRHDGDWLAGRFEEQRARLRGVAYRMLGSLAEADDAVQEAWLRLSRTDASDIDNLNGWLTTVVARVCLNMLRSRNLRREQPLDGDADVHVPDPIISRDERLDPENAALLADSVGLALLVVLETLAPAERLAFVLHDMFAISFDEIAAILGRSSEATRQLASRARRRVQRTAPVPDADLSAQRQVVDAFFAAAHSGDFEGLVAVLDPDIVLRSDGGALRRNVSAVLRGAETVAAQAVQFRQWAPYVRKAVINGTAGVVVGRPGQPFSVMAFTVRGGKIVEIDAVVDPERLARLDLTIFDE
jgi:RNA polymerase sigma-70 factor, ECF subfamily